MQRYILPILICFFSHALFAQQQAQYSLQMFNRMAYNPAYAGMDNSLSMTGVFRKQWVDLAGSPTSQHLNIHAPLPFLSSGFGIAFQNDELGAERNMSFTAAYNYQLPIGRTGTLAIGAGGGVIQQNLNGAIIRTPDGEYSDFTGVNHKDNILPMSTVSANAPALSVGAYYKSEILEIGISANNILEQKLAFTSFNVQPLLTYFFTATAHFDLNASISLHPSLFLKSDIIQTQTDFSLLISYDDNISIGTSFRGYDTNSIDAVALIGGLKVNEKMRLYYSYDLTLSDLNSVSTGSHEIMLNYNLNKDFGKGVPPPIIYNPRNL